MKLLLDTHALLWWHEADDRLSAHARNAIEDVTHTVAISMVSIWEMQIKLQLGKLVLKDSLLRLVAQQLEINRLSLLPISLPHILALEQLPLYHRDPFDRLLLAQALVEGLTLVSADAPLAAYPVPVLW
jgi:PIN domain nuclease of toxin-antitoxin system